MGKIDLKTALILVFVLAVIGGLVFSQSVGFDDTSLTIGIVALAIYFVPTIIAVHRNHRQKLPIFALNVLLGWTFIGWAVAIVWSLTAQSQPA